MKALALAVVLALTLVACGSETVPSQMSKSTKEQGNTVQQSSK